jgi:PhzF family phenazine biosynthesis protein
MTPVEIVSVFTHNGTGGNLCPLVAEAKGMSGDEMQAVAKKYGLEAGFVLPADTEDFDLALRFYVPNHEMEMCGHATVGALWLLARHGRLSNSTVRIATRSGPVAGFLSRGADGTPAVEITQPPGRVTPLTPDQTMQVLLALGVGPEALEQLPMYNAVTSRTKTLIPMRDVERLNALVPNATRVEQACRRIGSTGLYPYAVVDRAERTFEARQFPRSSGYPEDAATGIAAAALAFGLLADATIDADDRVIRIFQGRAMGRLSEIRVRLGFVGGRAIGCLLGGAVTPSGVTES